MPRKPKPHELRSRENRVRMNIEQAKYVPLPILPERHLFVTEGVKTEPLYLEGLINFIAQYRGSGVRNQLVVYGGGDNTLSLLRRAEAYQQSDADDFQHIWLIYDKDDFPSDDFDNTFYRCLALNECFCTRGWEREFHPIWSNECFEVWFLLHFMFLDANVHRTQYSGMLRNCLGKPYSKTDPSVFDSLYSLTDTAIRNAKKLMAAYSSEMPPSQRSPATNFYELAEKLISYMGTQAVVK